MGLPLLGEPILRHFVSAVHDVFGGHNPAQPVKSA